MKVLFGLIAIGLLLIIVILIESHREFKSYRIVGYDIKSKKIPASFDGYRILMLADLHNTCFKQFDDIENEIEQINPDIIVIAGDMITAHAGLEEQNAKTAGLINKLAKLRPLYYGIGNHERGARERTEIVKDAWKKYEALLNSDVILMDDKRLVLEKNGKSICLYGINIDRYLYNRLSSPKMKDNYIKEKLGSAKKDSYNILIAHNPEYFAEYCEWGADLVLSGHNHGGLIRLPFLGGVISPRLRLFPKYDRGLFKSGDSTMVLTSGLGGHVPKLRFNNKPEMCIITLNGKNE